MKTCGDHGGRRRDGKPCNNPAGFRATNETGKCYLHGGCSHGRPVIHGRYAKVTRERLAAKLENALEESSLPGLLSEAAMLRAILRHPDKIPEGERLPLIEEQAARILEAAASIKPYKSLNLSEQGYMIASLIDILQDKVDGDTLQAVIRETRRRLGYETLQVKH